MNSTAAPALIPSLPPSPGGAFRTRDGQRLTVKPIQTLVRVQVKAAGLSLRITPHALRHGYATHLLQRDADVRHVQKLLSHSQVQTTALYTRVVPRDLKEVLAKSHPRERLYNRRRKRASCRAGGK